jgi:hypothetical protein
MRKLALLVFVTLVVVLTYAIQVLGSYEGPAGSPFMEPVRMSNRLVELRFRKVGSLPWRVTNFDGTMYKWESIEEHQHFGFVTEIQEGHPDTATISVYQLQKNPQDAGYVKQVLVEQLDARIGEVLLTIETEGISFSIEVLGIHPGPPAPT